MRQYYFWRWKGGFSLFLVIPVVGEVCYFCNQIRDDCRCCYRVDFKVSILGLTQNLFSRKIWIVSFFNENNIFTITKTIDYGTDEQDFW